MIWCFLIVFAHTSLAAENTWWRVE